MNDDEFLEAFQNNSLGAAEFDHRGHLRLSWLSLKRYGFHSGSTIVAEGIRRFAASKGALDKYHETLTQFWLRLVYHAIQSKPTISDFENFLDAFPILLNKDLPLRHWHPETIGSSASRGAWVEPEILQLP